MAIGIERKIKQFLDKVLWKQDDLLVPVTYKRYVQTTRDPDTKTTTDVYSDTELDAVITGDTSYRTRTGDNRWVSLRAHGYVTRASDMPEGYSPDDVLKDLMVIGESKYNVLSAEKILDVAYFIKVTH